MQTQCPHCETRFRVTESQVNTADGFVRCSVCKEVFNAFEVAEQHELQQSLLRQANDPEEELTEDRQHKDLTIDLTDNLTDNLDAPTGQTENTQHSSIDSTTETPYLSLDEAQITNSTTDEITGIDAVDFNTTPADDDLRKDAFDFFDEESNESLPHVVPEKFKDSYSSGSSTILSSLLWSVGILLLTVTLLIEYTWFNRDKLNQVPELQVWTEKLCQQIDCRDIAMRNPEKIELIARNVYSHPNEKDALMVNITMKNHAEFAQPYPVMQINFSDVRGGSVAARRFFPTEYLPRDLLSENPGKTLLLEPDTNMTFSMEIQDPGKQAMTYQFDFL